MKQCAQCLAPMEGNEPLCNRCAGRTMVIPGGTPAGGMKADHTFVLSTEDEKTTAQGMKKLSLGQSPTSDKTFVLDANAAEETMTAVPPVSSARGGTQVIGTGDDPDGRPITGAFEGIDKLFETAGVCPQCYTPLKKGGTSCDECGYRLTGKYCKSCGKVVGGEQHFCPTCKSATIAIPVDTDGTGPAPMIQKAEPPAAPPVQGLPPGRQGTMVEQSIPGGRSTGPMPYPPPGGGPVPPGTPPMGMAAHGMPPGAYQHPGTPTMGMPATGQGYTPGYPQAVRPPAKSGSMAPLIIILALLVLGGGGFALWYFVLRDQGTTTTTTGPTTTAAGTVKTTGPAGTSGSTSSNSNTGGLFNTGGLPNANSGDINKVIQSASGNTPQSGGTTVPANSGGQTQPPVTIRGTTTQVIQIPSNSGNVVAPPDTPTTPQAPEVSPYVRIQLNAAALNMPGQNAMVALSFAGVSPRFDAGAPPAVPNVEKGTWPYNATVVYTNTATGEKERTYQGSGTIDIKYEGQRLTIRILGDRVNVK